MEVARNWIPKKRKNRLYARSNCFQRHVFIFHYNTCFSRCDSSTNCSPSLRPFPRRILPNQVHRYRLLCLHRRCTLCLTAALPVRPGNISLYTSFGLAAPPNIVAKPRLVLLWQIAVRRIRHRCGMVDIPHFAITCQRSDEHGTCTQICEHLATESDGGYHQYEGKLRRPVGGYGRRSAVGCLAPTDRFGWNITWVGGAFQDLSLHLRHIYHRVLGIDFVS